MDKPIPQMLFTCLILLLAMFPRVLEAKIVDRILAIVNGEIITMQEVNTRIDVYLKRSPTKDEARLKALRKNILNSLIDIKLIEHGNKELGITVTDKEVEQAMERIRKSSGLSQENFEIDVKRTGMTMALVRQDVRDQLNRMKLVEKTMRPRIIISKDAVRAYYKEHQDEYKIENKIHLRNILLLIPSGATKDDIQVILEQAKEITEKIRAGLDFSEAVRKFSKDRNARTGGDMGLLSSSDLAKVIRDALKDLEEGQITQPLRLGQTVQILQLVQRLDQEDKIFIRAQKDIQEILEQRELKKRFEKWFEELRAKSVIEIKL
ncbi:MAG: peptidylprolyl isomerase [Deltaproteobacteria bacterium]|nr:peptidylprolyl isomerase [Deltaproteobacteria bacterium]